MAYLFPIGTIAAASDSGTLESVSYSMFEPNNDVISYPIYDILVSKFENQTPLTRKKKDPYLMIEYSYSNIFTREYRQLKHFVDVMEDALTSFYIVDFSAGQTPTSITDSGGDWVVAIDNTRLYSTVTNSKACRAFIWNGRSWKEGPITSISTNTSITVDVDTSNYGGLSVTDANSSGMLYPIYTVYLAQESISNFKATNFLPGTISTSQDGGNMYSGTLTFISKYYV